MIISFVGKVAAVVASALEWVFMAVVNAILIPLSFTYSALTNKASADWLICNVGRPCFYWWSAKARTAMQTVVYRGGKHSTSVLKLDNPKSFMAFFAIALLPVLVSYVASLLWKTAAGYLTKLSERLNTESNSDEDAHEANLPKY